jgi:hypothetical protein
MKIPPNETTVKSDVLDGTEAVKFLKKLRPKGPWILTAIVDDKRIVTRSFTDLDAAQEFVCDHNGDGFNLY